jgi:trimethylguanosine synthase
MEAHANRYWNQRYKIFSKYDEGIWMTDDSWFGVTPEPVAKFVTSDRLPRITFELTSGRTIAEHVAKAAPKSKTILIDAFGGASGNAIAFALSGRWQQIFVFEKDPHVMKCAKHNAGIYGVEKKIMWVQADSLAEIPKRFRKHIGSAVIFASPPWGGIFSMFRILLIFY